MLIGIAGTLGAGKGTVVEHLKDRGFEHYSASAKLREILESRGEKIDRNAYSHLADEIRIKDPEGLAKLLWSDYIKHQPDNAVIEALHDIGEAEFVHNQGAVLLGVDADMKLRFERIAGRGSEKDNVTFDEFKKIAEHEEEGGGEHNIRAVINHADYVIENNGTLEELHQKIDEFLAQYEN